MSILRAITASEAAVAAGVACRLYSISFPSDDEDIYVKIREDGVSGGTVRFRAHLDSTTDLGDTQFAWVSGDPKGAFFKNGLYVDFSNDDGSTAGTGTINIEIDPAR